MSTPEAKAERKRRSATAQERLQRRFDEGDPTLRKTIFRNIKPRRTGGIRVGSAEGVRFYNSEVTISHEIGRVVSETELDQQPGIISVEVLEDRDTALLRIRQVDGEVLKFSVPTSPIVEPTLPSNHSD